MAPRLALLVACSALAVSAGACAVLLDLPAPELGDSGGPPIEASVPQPDASDGAGDSTMDTSADTGPDQTSRDGGTEDTSPDTAMEAAVADAPPDVEADASGFVLCSLTGSFSCDPLSSTPDCCETASDSSSTPSFTCVPKNSCSSGYDIQCANADECPGMEICCHYSSGMKCAAPSSSSTCPGGSVTQACDPNNTTECPQNQTCTLHLTNNGMPSPYLGCE